MIKDKDRLCEKCGHPLSDHYSTVDGNFFACYYTNDCRCKTRLLSKEEMYGKGRVEPKRPTTTHSPLAREEEQGGTGK